MFRGKVEGEAKSDSFRPACFLVCIQLTRFSPLFFNRDVPCVTYESVDRAFNEAKQKMNLPGPRGRSMTDIDVDHLGQILVETSRNLARE